MDSYRVSDVNASMINRSYFQHNNVKSNTESVVDFQNNQTKFYKITMFVILLLVGACLLLMGHMWLNRLVDRADDIDRSGWTKTDKLKYIVFNTVPKHARGTDVEAAAVSSGPGFFENLKEFWASDRSCGHLRELEQRLRGQRFAVQKHVEHLPSFEYVKSHREKYELSNELNRSCLEGDLASTRATFDAITTDFDNLVGVGHLDLKSNADDFSTVNEQLREEEARFKDVERLLDNEFVYNVKGDANNLVNSAKNLQEKKILLNGHRHGLFNHMRHLEAIINDIKNEKDVVDSEKLRELDLIRRLNEAEAQVLRYEKSVHEKEHGMGGKHSNELAELRQLNDQIDEIRASIANAGKVKADCQARREKVSRDQAKANDIDHKLNDIQREIDSLNAQRREKNSALKSIDDGNDIHENRRMIHQIKLDVLLRNKDIKEFLEKMINSKTNMKDLSKLVNSKISDEENLIALMNKYNEDSARMDAMEGTTVVDVESVSSDSVKNRIEKDREDFRRIMEKFLGLKKVVEEYEDPDLEIRNLKIKIQDIDDKKKHTASEQRRLRADIDRLDKAIHNLESQIQSLTDKRNSLLSSIEMDEKLVRDKEAQLFDAERRLNDLLGQKAVLDQRYKDVRERFEHDFKEISILYHNAKGDFNSIKSQLHDARATIAAHDGRLMKLVLECVSLKLYISEIGRLIPVLQAGINADNDAIRELKTRIYSSLSFINNL